MTCNDCGREISDCDRNGCREVRGTTWGEWALAQAKKETDCPITAGVKPDSSPDAAAVTEKS